MRNRSTLSARTQPMPRMLPQQLITACAALLTALTLTSQMAWTQESSLAPPTPYTASYQARAMGMRTDAYRELTQLDDGSYQIRHGLDLSLLGATLISVEESSHFDWQAHGAVPRTYSFQQGGVRKRDEQITFDWQAGTATLLRDGRREESELQAGQIDRLSSTVQMSALLQQMAANNEDLAAGGQTLRFTLQEINEVDEHEYLIEGEEIIETLAGELRTLRIERVREPDRDRSTTIWVAVDHEYTLARLVQIEDGSRTELQLRSITLNP